MNDRSEMDAFEQRLTNLVRAYTEPAERPADALAIARRAMHAPASRMARLELAWWPAVDQRVVALLVAAGLLIALTVLAIAGGSLQRHNAGPLAVAGDLVFARDGDLLTSRGDGSGVTRIRDGGAEGTALGYLAAIWSPDLRHIAAVRDVGGPVLTPVIEIMATNGSDVRTIELGAGGMPSLSWSPEGSQLAVARYPGDVARDAIEPVRTRPQLRIVGVDGASSEIGLPSGASHLTGAQPGLWTQPSAGLHWSPDGRWIAAAWDGAGSLDRWHLVAADGGTIQTLTSFTQRRCGVAAWIDWFPDGRRLATVGGDQVSDRLCVEAIGSGEASPADSPSTAIIQTAEASSSNVHEKLDVTSVSPNGERVAVIAESADFANARHTTALRVYDLVSDRLTDVASGTQAIVFDAPGAGHVDGTLDGTPVWGPIAWTQDGSQLRFLSPTPGDLTASWTLVSVDAAGGGQPLVILGGIRSFDVAGAP